REPKIYHDPTGTLWDTRRARQSAGLHQKLDGRSFLSFNHDLGERGNGYQVDAIGGHKSAGDSDRLDRLVHRTRSNRLQLNRSPLPQHGRERTRDGLGFRVRPDLEHLRHGSMLPHCSDHHPIHWTSTISYAHNEFLLEPVRAVPGRISSCTAPSGTGGQQSHGQIGGTQRRFSQRRRLRHETGPHGGSLIPCGTHLPAHVIGGQRRQREESPTPTRCSSSSTLGSYVTPIGGTPQATA